ncbi:MAG: hypothetical protein ABEK02_09180 [Haloquadratum sp.]
MRAAPLALALLLVLSSLVGATPALSTGDGPRSASASASASAPTVPPRSAAIDESVPTQVASSTNASAATISVLGIPDGAATRSTLETEYVELGSSLAFSSATTDARLTTATAVERIESAPSSETRQRYLLQEVSAVEQRIVALRARQRQVIAAYGRGEITQRQLLYQLALVDVRARELDRRRARLETLVQSTPGFSISSSRFGNIELELQTLMGPVRGYAAAVLRGEAPSARFFVQSGPDSVVVAVIRDGTYVREVYRGPLRQRSGGSISLTQAVDITERAYPTVAALSLREDTLGNPDSDSTRVTVEHRRGRLIAFVDSGSKRVFKAYQFRPLDQVATRAPTSAVKDALNLTAHRTYPGGPVRLQLNSTITGEPVDAQITVGPAGGRSSVVGRTGEDGSLWILAPSGPYQVTAIDGSSVVVLSVDPTATPLVYGSVTGNATGGEPGTATATPTERS